MEIEGKFCDPRKTCTAVFAHGGAPCRYQYFSIYRFIGYSRQLEYYTYLILFDLRAVFFSVLVVVVKSSLTLFQVVVSQKSVYQAAHLVLQSSCKCWFNFQVDRRQRLILQAEEESNNDKSPPQKIDPDSPGKLLLLPGLLSWFLKTETLIQFTTIYVLYIICLQWLLARKKLSSFSSLLGCKE